MGRRLRDIVDRVASHMIPTITVPLLASQTRGRVAYPRVTVQALDGIGSIGCVRDIALAEKAVRGSRWTAYAIMGILDPAAPSPRADRVGGLDPARRGREGDGRMLGRELRSAPKPAYRTDPIRRLRAADSRYPDPSRHVTADTSAKAAVEMLAKVRHPRPARASAANPFAYRAVCGSG